MVNYCLSSCDVSFYNIHNYIYNLQRQIAVAGKLLSKGYAESQDGHVNSVIEDNFDPDYENVEFIFLG